MKEFHTDYESVIIEYHRIGQVKNTNIYINIKINNEKYYNLHK